MENGKLKNLESGRYDQLDRQLINSFRFSQLQMTAAGDQNMAAR